MGHTSSSVPGPLRFDSQADSFDRRAGLPEAAVERIADALLALRPTGSWLLEIGAGTGAIGARVAALGGGRYVGLDLSLPMLAEARARHGQPLLVQSDADRSWPLAEGRVGLVFLSRAAHLLDGEHLVAEACRLAHPAGARLVLGRVQRQPDSVRAAIRRRAHELLAERGLPRRDGRSAGRRLLAEIAERGGRTEPERTAATWMVHERPADSLASWRSKEGLAGNALPTRLRNAILADLEAWARERFGDLLAVHETSESYELAAAELPPAAREERA